VQLLEIICEKVKQILELERAHGICTFSVRMGSLVTISPIINEQGVDSTDSLTPVVVSSPIIGMSFCVPDGLQFGNISHTATAALAKPQ